MIVATALVVVRTLIVIWLAARFRRLPRTNFAGPISVVIAAYNEEKLIAETLRTLFATDYKGEIEVVVVDDGSTDQTASEIERIARNESRIRLFQQENRGKARALQRGLTAPTTGSWFSLMPTRNVNATRCRVCSSHLRMSASAQCQVMRRLGICARSSRVVRRWNIPAASIWIGALTIAGTVSLLSPARLAPFGRMRSMKRRSESANARRRHRSHALVTRHRQRIVYVPKRSRGPKRPRRWPRSRDNVRGGPTVRCNVCGNIATWCSTGTIARSAGSAYQHLVLSDRSDRHYADRRFIPAGLSALRRVERGDAVRHHIPCDGRAARHARVYFGTRTNPARLAHLTNAPDLSPMLSYCVWKAILRAIKGAGSAGANSSAPPACQCVHNRESPVLSMRTRGADRAAWVCLMQPGCLSSEPWQPRFCPRSS
jgi:Glycosyltransferases involved in cell wall biogenesis